MIIEIALGILLALLILWALPAILAIGIVAIGIVLIVGALGLVVYLVANPETQPFVLAFLMVVVVLGGFVVLVRFGPTWLRQVTSRLVRRYSKTLVVNATGSILLGVVLLGALLFWLREIRISTLANRADWGVIWLGVGLTAIVFVLAVLQAFSWRRAYDEHIGRITGGAQPASPMNDDRGEKP